MNTIKDLSNLSLPSTKTIPTVVSDRIVNPEAIQKLKDLLTAHQNFTVTVTSKALQVRLPLTSVGAYFSILNKSELAYASPLIMNALTKRDDVIYPLIKTHV